MNDATDLKAHRIATSPAARKGANDKRGRLIGRTKGGMNVSTGFRLPSRVERCFVDCVVTDVVSGGGCRAEKCSGLSERFPGIFWVVFRPGHTATASGVDCLK